MPKNAMPSSHRLSADLRNGSRRATAENKQTTAITRDSIEMAEASGWLGQSTAKPPTSASLKMNRWSTPSER